MVVLSDKDIKQYIKEKKIIIENLDMNNIGPCSIDFRLGNKFRIFKNTNITHIDIKQGLDEKYMEIVEKQDNESFVVHPGELILAITKEKLKMPDDLVATLDGRSSLGRIGLVVHSTANSFDPGFEGYPTLEICNISKVPVAIWPNHKICRFTFTKLSSPSELPYNKKPNAKYHNQQEPSVSKIHQD